jgi:hypothetical protein
MNRKTELFFHDVMFKGNALGGLFLSIFMICFFNRISLDHRGLCASPLLGVLLAGLFGYLLFTDVLKLGEQRLDLNKAIWRYSLDAFPVLSLLKGSYRVFMLGSLAFSAEIIRLSVQLIHCVLFEASPVKPCLKIMESSILYGWTSPGGELLFACGAIGLAVYFSTTIGLVSKWQKALKTASDDQATIEALDKLTSIELYLGHLVKADNYSLRLLNLAEVYQPRS